MFGNSGGGGFPPTLLLRVKKKQTLPDKFEISPKVTRVFVRFVNLEVKIVIFTSK